MAAARRQVEAARGSLTAAQANLVNPAMRSAQVAAVQGQIVQARADIIAAQADAERARAQLDEAQANRKDLNVIAPFTGTVATRTAEPGEVVMAGVCLPVARGLRFLPRNATICTSGLISIRDLRGLDQLITQRTAVQIRPPQLRKTRGYGSCRSPFGFSLGF